MVFCLNLPDHEVRSTIIQCNNIYLFLTTYFVNACEGYADNIACTNDAHNIPPVLHDLLLGYYWLMDKGIIHHSLKSRLIMGAIIPNMRGGKQHLSSTDISTTNAYTL